MREIIEVTRLWNTGIHQFGFRRLAAVILDCGHHTTFVYGANPHRAPRHPRVGEGAYCCTCDAPGRVRDAQREWEAIRGSGALGGPLLETIRMGQRAGHVGFVAFPSDHQLAHDAMRELR